MKKTFSIFLTLATLIAAGCSGSSGPKVIDPNQYAQQGYGGVPPIGLQSLSSTSGYPFYGQNNLQSMNQCIQQCYMTEKGGDKALCPDACKNAYYGSIPGIPLDARGLPMVNLQDPYGYNRRMGQWGSTMNFQQYVVPIGSNYRQIRPGTTYMMPYRSSFNRDPYMTNGCYPASHCSEPVNSAYFYSMGNRVAAVDQYVYSLENDVPYTGPDFVAEDAACEDDEMVGLVDLESLGKGVVRRILGSAARIGNALFVGAANSIVNIADQTAYGLERGMRGFERGMSIRNLNLHQAKAYGRALHQSRFINPTQVCEYPDYQYSFDCPR